MHKQAAELDLVLVGGGHAHALALRMFAMQKPAGLRVTLISPSAFTPYSGMLPGLLAGHYSFEETHVDVARLSQWAGARFYADTVTALDPVNRRLICRERGEVAFDFVSIDIGSQPELDSVPGAREHAIPVKPVAGLWERWSRESADGTIAAGPVAVVGGGAGSVEIALAVAHRLRDARPSINLYCGADQVLPGYPASVRRVVESRLKDFGIALHRGEKVTSVEASRLHFETAGAADFHSLIWCTGAAAAPWIAESGLPVDERGFMTVKDSLQSTGFEHVFGAGDIAVQVNHPRPKAGVFAVRQAPVLAHNLLAAVRGSVLREHRPQTRFLSLLSLGDDSAVAERNGLSMEGAWVWRWKDRIDRGFMERFTDLPAPVMTPDSSSLEQAPCGGCGAKLAADTLREVLAELRGIYPDSTPQPADLDDAVAVPGSGPLLQSIDALRALVDDPWRMGRIAAQHALSDLYASGAEPHSAQALVTLPFASESLLRRDLRSALGGALSIFSDAGCRLIGGHSMQGPEFQLGFVVNGTLSGQAMLSKRGAMAGDKLLLTGALGSGALFAAHMQLKADGRHVESALTAMERGNGFAASVARSHGVCAMTDITGFGLAGHLLEMLGAGLSARLDLDGLPVLDGALEAMQAGVFSTLQEGNRAAAGLSCRLPGSAGLRGQLLFDPQTSGGLLMAVPADRAEAACKSLREADVEATLIGEVLAAGAEGPLIDAA